MHFLKLCKHHSNNFLSGKHPFINFCIRHLHDINFPRFLHYLIKPFSYTIYVFQIQFYERRCPLCKAFSVTIPRENANETLQESLQVQNLAEAFPISAKSPCHRNKLQFEVFATLRTK